MNNIIIKKSLLAFIIFNILIAIFYLNNKHTVGNDSSVSEWLINYQGGFTRRGLGGELGIYLSNLFDISLRRSIFLIQSSTHTIYLVLVYIYFRNFKLNILEVFALYTPIFLLYPISEIEVLGRKEIFLFTFFITILFFSKKNYNCRIINSQIFLITPLICLIWEQIVLFFPFFATVLIIKNNLKTFNEVFRKLFIIFLPSILTIIFIFITPMSNGAHEIMCDFLKNKFGEDCYMSANYLITSTVYFDTLWIHENPQIKYYIRYISDSSFHRNHSSNQTQSNLTSFCPTLHERYDLAYSSPAVYM